MTKVELTKVHYYDSDKLNRNVEITTISRQLTINTDRNPIIKKNIFGHRWVLKINDNKNVKNKRCNFKVILYVFVFFCLILAVAFGIYFTLESYFVKTNKTDIDKSNNTLIINNNISELIKNETSTHLSSYKEVNKTDDLINEKHFCDMCLRDEVCLKDNAIMACVKIKDVKDPTGCGGICKINTQHCKLLDVTFKLYECKDNMNILKCPIDHFNCGNMCINKSRRCDGVINCSNKSDELNCPCDLRTHFQCGNNTSCLDNKRKCDGTIDCWDKSDEINCFTVCQTDEVMCNNKQCIKSEYFCDGHYHCLDNSDEPFGCQR